jgi:hypothetical protein
MYYKFTFNKYNFLLTRHNSRDLALIGCSKVSLQLSFLDFYWINHSVRNETSNFSNIQLDNCVVC